MEFIVSDVVFCVNMEHHSPVTMCEGDSTISLNVYLFDPHYGTVLRNYFRFLQCCYMIGKDKIFYYVFGGDYLIFISSRIDSNMECGDGMPKEDEEHFSIVSVEADSIH